MAVANYNAIAALPGSFAIRFDSHSDQQDLWEHAPRDGDLLNHTPAAMFTDTAIYWIERVRGDTDGVTLTDDNGADYNAISIGFHRGDSTVAQSEFLGGLAAEWSWVLINETTEEWIMWPANAGQQGSGFATYNITPVGIVDTAGNDRLVAAVAQSFTLDSVLTTPADFQNSLISSELVVGLIPNNTFRPTFGPAPVELMARPLAAAATLGRPMFQEMAVLASQSLAAEAALGRPAFRGTVTLAGQALSADAAFAAPTLSADVPPAAVFDVPSAPRFVTAAPTGQRSVDLEWAAPLSDGGAPITSYEVCVVDESGVAEPFRTADAAASHVVRGLAYWHEYGFRVRAVNIAGVGAQSPLVRETPRPEAIEVTVPDGFRIPLADLDRQSLIVRLGSIDCRVRVWWQPSDGAWYASLEVPIDTPIVRGRRLTVNRGLLDRIDGVLAGNVVVRPVDESDAETDPVRDAWERSSHALMWEPAA